MVCQDRLRTYPSAQLGANTTRIQRRADVPHLMRKRSFLSFPYVCPEPVLVKSSFLYINGSKSAVFSPVQTHITVIYACMMRVCNTNHRWCFEFRLGASRACLGKPSILLRRKKLREETVRGVWRVVCGVWCVGSSLLLLLLLLLTWGWM